MTPAGPRIRNPYFLLTYGWQEVLDEAFVAVGASVELDALELIARLFLRHAARVIARGVDRGYRSDEDETRRPRGRILAAPTLSRALHLRGVVACEAQELTADVAHNRALRAWLGRLSRCTAITTNFRAEAFRLHARLDGVREEVDSRTIQLHRNVAHYGPIVRLGRLLDGCLLPTPDGSQWLFPDTAREDLMARVFEAFVREVLRSHGHPEAQKERGRFMNARAVEGDASLLPDLETDITLATRERHLVIETKFYREVLVAHRGGRRRLRSDHLFQLLAYLRNARPERPGVVAEGLLIYAKAAEPVFGEFVLDGHRVRVGTIDLDQDSTELVGSILALVDGPTTGDIPSPAVLRYP